jgi:hypothetical protein
MKDKLQELSAVWYDLVSIDHHKDRDCHFYINKVYSYGKPPHYRIGHYGYISELPKELSEEMYEDATTAQTELTNWLKNEIKETLQGYQEVDKTCDFNWKGAKEMVEKYKQYLK